MELTLAYYDNPILRKKCEEVEVVDEKIRDLVHKMIETLIDHNGIGLAGPQVNLPLRIFITAVPIEQPDGNWSTGKLRVFINPEILWVSDERVVRSEGCLSIPKLYADVERPSKVRVKALDLDGQEFQEEFDGLEARCILHENDHINGVLFIDRIRGKERRRLETQLRQIKKKFSQK